MNYCTRCGQPAGDASASCVSCGAPLATGQDMGRAGAPAAPQPDGTVRIFGDRPLEPTGNVRIIGGPTAGEEIPASYGGPAFPAPGSPDGELEPGLDPGEDTAAWLPGFTARAPVPALRPRERPVRADPPPPRRPVILPPGGDGGPAGNDDLHPGDPAAHQPPESPGQVPGWLKIAVVLVLLAGGLGAWYYFGRPRPPASASSAARTPRPQATQPSPSYSSRPTAPSRPAAPPESKLVVLGPGVAGPNAAGVAAFLTRYFAAINQHDYQAFSSLFEPGASPVQSGAEFRSGYRTSRDSGGRLVTLGQTAGGEWAASLTFDSHQDPASSATHTSCTTWGVTFDLVPVGNSYLIGPAPPGYQASARPCG